MDTRVSDLAALRGFVDRHPRLFVLTGRASAPIPAFRIIATPRANGRKPPMPALQHDRLAPLRPGPAE